LTYSSTNYKTIQIKIIKLLSDQVNGEFKQLNAFNVYATGFTAECSELLASAEPGRLVGDQKIVTRPATSSAMVIKGFFIFKYFKDRGEFFYQQIDGCAR
jgi:hypothetical protein